LVPTYCQLRQSFVSAAPLSPAYVRSTTCHHLTSGTRGMVLRDVPRNKPRLRHNNEDGCTSFVTFYLPTTVYVCVSQFKWNLAPVCASQN